MSDFEALHMQYFVYIVGFIGALILFEGLRNFIKSMDSASDRKVSRLRRLQGEDMMAGRLLSLRQNRKVSRLDWIPYFGNLPVRMRQSGMTMKPHMLLMIAGLCTTSLYLLFQQTLGPVAGIIAAPLAGLYLPMAIINIQRKKRISAFTQQLPEALDLMKRGLSVGHPLNVTMRAVAEQMSEPLASEFHLMSNQIEYGDTLVDAVKDMADRLDIEDTHYLSAAIQIQHGSGGNLGELLGTLSSVIRQRFAMRRRVLAVSSEGRISAIILTSLPFVMYGGTLITAPTYYSSVSDDPLFWPMCAAIAFFVIGNGLMMKKLINFKF